MELQEISQFFRKYWKTLTVWALAFATIAFVVSIIQPQKYRSDQRFLIVQTYAEDVDPYAATRSTEYISNLLSEVVYSQSFMRQVFTAGFGINETSFPTEAKKLNKAWKKTVRTRVLADTGILEVSVYFPDRYQTDQLAQAVGYVLRNNHKQYHGRGNSLTIQVIDAPITSVRPVVPNIPLNAVVGALLGLFTGLIAVYVREKKGYLPKEKLVEPIGDLPFAYMPQSYSMPVFRSDVVPPENLPVA